MDELKLLELLLPAADSRSEVTGTSLDPDAGSELQHKQHSWDIALKAGSLN